MIDLETEIRDCLFVDGKFSRQRARSAENQDLIKRLRELVGGHNTISETVFAALGGKANMCSCGKKTEYVSFSKGYRLYCSLGCMASSKQVKEKRSQSIKATCLEKYGSTNVFGVGLVRQKAQDTMLRRYGVDNFAKHSLHRDLVSQTSLKKYGVDHPLRSAEVKSKIKSAMIEKHGGFTTSSPELSAKMRSTMVDRYGAQASWSSDVLLPKLHEWQRKRFLDRVREVFSIQGISDTIRVQHSCGHTFDLNFFDKLSCPGCKETSRPEHELFMFISSLGVEVNRNDRTLLGGRELDLVLPQHKIAIERNGAWWHHDATEKMPLLAKTKAAAACGFQLLHIWDFEWYEKQNIIKSIIRSKLGLLQKIPARKCQVREIDTAEAKQFLETFHLQGSCRSSKKLGMFYNDLLVGVATFGAGRFKNNGTELLRMAFATVQVIGGVSKFLKAIDGDLMTYADLRFGTGNGYIAAGMKPNGATQPGYCWFSRGVALGRYETQKSKLPALLGEACNPSLSEDANMRAAGFLKLIDCGHGRFIR